MSIDELIERLEEYRDSIGGDAEVRLMTQRNWPFENSIIGVCSQEEIADIKGKKDASENVLYIVEGQQLGYGMKAAWEIAQ
jgi:hypothetical protein